MSKRNLEWEDYKEKITKKRTGKKKDKAGPSGLCGSITVQRHSANVEGKCQKYYHFRATVTANIFPRCYKLKAFKFASTNCRVF